MLSDGKYLRRLIVSAVFLAVALVLRMFFSFYIPLFGEAGMRVNIAGIFSDMPAILFGPVLGGLTSGAADVLGFMLRPTGAFIPLMTVVAVAGGILRGALWLFLRNRCVKKMRICVGIFAAVMLIFGAANILMINADGLNSDFFENGECSENLFLISRWLVERSENVSNPPEMLASMITTVTRGPVGASFFGLLLLVLDIVISALLKKSGMEYSSVMPLLLAMLISTWFSNSINTVLLIYFQIPSWRLLPFVVVWLPRIIQATIVTTVSAYFVALLLGACKKQPTVKDLMA
ncbi:MAG: ECF transporter S component [Defluviitaleaceae bacterium]|nr:ECF transporter S component [Defluviitaleaceae bacterium]